MSTTAPLAGRVALVSGASRGIGLAVARALVEAGARVAMVARSADALRAAAVALGPTAYAVPGDVTRADDVTAIFARIDSLLGTPPDILVNNAGVFTIATIEDATLEDLRRALDTNLVGGFLLARAALPAMRARGAGHIVSIGSAADRAIYPGNAAYAASKFGARALHETLRAELRGSGIRTSLISPAAVDTPIWDPLAPETRPGFPPRATMLRPEHVAASVMFALLQPPMVNVDELRLSTS